MKKLILTTAVVLSALVAQADDNIATRLQNLSCTVHAGKSQGSGTIITRGGVNFVLTAGHVVAGNRTVDKVVKDGRVIFLPKFTPVTIVKEIYVDDRSVGTTTVEAEIIAYSSSDYGQDLALLKLRSTVITESAEFYTGRTAPVGTDVVHVGSLLGQEGSNSYTVGSISQVGRTLDDKLYDQSSCPSFPGSSGGGIYAKDGKYVGMLVRGGGETFNFFIPVRRIHQWAKDQNVDFIFDPKAKVDFANIKLENGEPLEASDKPGDSYTLLVRP